MDAEPPRALYDERLAELRATLAALEARSGRISSLRGITFLVAVALGAARIFGPVPVIVWVLAALAATAFVALVIVHAALVTRTVGLELRVRLLEQGQKRIAGELQDLPSTGERFAVNGHAYAGDLDVFGRASLFQLVSATETGAGEAVLARWLAEPADAKEIHARQEAARELAALPRLREDLQASASESGTKGKAVEPFLAWAEGGDAGPIAGRLALARAIVPVTVALFVVSQIAGNEGPSWLRILWLIPLVAQLVVLATLRPIIEPVLAIASSREAPFGRYVALFRLIESTTFRAPRLVALREVLTRAGAARAIGSLDRILGFADLRHSGIVAVFANIFLLWDAFVAAALFRWRAEHGVAVRGWIAAMAEIEALASLGTFAAEHPAFAFPDIDDGDLRFVAEGLGHPLIPASRRVSNDVDLPRPGATLMITGSNMSGKSTLLRAVGVNAVLALAGAPVCARKLSMAVCDVRSSMRIKDSLEEGVSHFYAELERLKAVVDAVDGGDRVLFLLDEVLHGTNSRERNIGAKAVIRHLVEKGAVGGVSSHDLGLADLEREASGRVTNVHFQELVGDGKMVFDYKLKPGVVTSSNALRLMKLVGIRVALPDE
ncbi:MutS-related protein, family 1 [Minicystis rosea]|nr:MutS-related protein, family 1 [Minicystis rosea]